MLPRFRPEKVTEQNLLSPCRDDADAALRKKDAVADACAQADLREHDRLKYTVAGGIRLRIRHPGGSESLYIVLPYNLSVSGVGFLHGGYLYPGSTCHAELIVAGGERRWIAGKVARCSHMSKKIHDVGVKFDDLIDPRWCYDAAFDSQHNDVP